ncbi:hypothetical protein B0O99DRAFT_387539 [Bisporella sp. PMI_857]|nr:hypothetical protein B0O99DRAFT_387539 [Bisporella sp. PMI_857]
MYGEPGYAWLRIVHLVALSSAIFPWRPGLPGGFCCKHHDYYALLNSSTSQFWSCTTDDNSTCTDLRCIRVTQEGLAASHTDHISARGGLTLQHSVRRLCDVCLSCTARRKQHSLKTDNSHPIVKPPGRKPMKIVPGKDAEFTMVINKHSLASKRTINVGIACGDVVSSGRHG